MPSIVFNANAPLKDRNGIVPRDPKPGAKHLFATKLRSIILLLALLPPTLDVSMAAPLPPKGNQMAAERFYIYRCGRTDSCAVTATKNEARLLRSLCPTSWQFWMQITRYQFEDGPSGFSFDAAIAGIKAKGYFLFTGSPELLGKLVSAPGSEGPSDVR